MIASSPVSPLFSLKSGESPSRSSGFTANEPDLFEFEKNQQDVFDGLWETLHRVHPSLTFEVGPVEDGRRDFVISADGIRAAFPKSMPSTLRPRTCQGGGL